jgi:hypothetical protein
VALVITLILLSVITFMAITFLVVSRSEKNSVTVGTDLTMARLAADTARERAMAEMLAPMLATNSPFNYGLLVSTNYVKADGYDPSLGQSLLNVNYDYYTKSAGPLSLPDQLQNIQNLFYNPRPPVFIVTNANPPNGISNDFRFFINLNRNTTNGIPVFDPTGILPVLGTDGQPIRDANGNIVTAPMVGDPQWIGMMQHPELFHSPTNLFTSRFAYMVVPIGQALDLNTIHNDAKHMDIGTKPGDGFLRNQGVLTAEINLAAFLADLNTNYWSTYNYVPFTPGSNPYLGPNTGFAFDDASALLRYRYSGSWNTLASVKTLLPNGAAPFSADWMDGYSAGPIMLGTSWPSGTVDSDQARVNQSWSGAENPGHFFSTQDLFDQNKTRPLWLGAKAFSFTDRLLLAGSDTNSSYNRYTFYRLLSQLGTDSATEPEDKMNLNYCNVDASGHVVPDAVTNFVAWSPVQFFTNAAIRMLVDAGYAVGQWYSTSNLLVLDSNIVSGQLVWRTNLHIPIWPPQYSLYTPSVQRILQLAANLYDATATNQAVFPTPPSVFAPIFRGGPGGSPRAPAFTFVTGYNEVTNNADTVIQWFRHPCDLTEDVRLPGDMVYNIPLIIGAKRGLPSFDEFSMDTQVQAARKLIYHRQSDDPSKPVNEIDPEYLLCITNVIGMQAWNSYFTNFPSYWKMRVWPDFSVYVTNLTTGATAWSSRPVQTDSNIVGFPWPAYNTFSPSYSFVTPLGSPTASYTVMPTNTVFSFRNGGAFVVNGLPDRSGRTNYTVPQLQVTVKARLRYALIDTLRNRILDYVNLETITSTNLTALLTLNSDGNPAFPVGSSYRPVFSRGAMWATNTGVGGLDPTETFGVALQIDVSAGRAANVGSVDWTSSLVDPVYGGDRDKGVARFSAQFGLSLSAGTYPPMGTFAAPFQPFRNVRVVTLWQANDPLVHHTVPDVQNTVDFPQSCYLDQLPQGFTLPPSAYGTLNKRYEPWGGRPQGSSGLPYTYDWRRKDPVAKDHGSSDDWEFPTNKFPNPGWIGRVHRGTPWQTAYLKAPSTDLASWTNWTGNHVIDINIGQFSTNIVIPPAFIAFPPRVTPPVTFTNGTVGVYDAFFTMPTNDWRLVDLFSTALSPNATRGRLSINQTNLAAWSAVLSGVVGLTNYGEFVDSRGIVNGVVSPQVIQPAGAYDTNPLLTNQWPAVARIVKGINDTRALFPGGVFHRLGDILSVPELSSVPEFNRGSPLLTPTPIQYNTPLNPRLSDSAFERIPQQVLGLLKADSVPRFVIYAYGQTLRPAQRSRVTSGPFFGLVTNYQVTAEVATRTVVRFEGAPPYIYGSPTTLTNLHPVIESFTVLPPD